jgi:hypothetical protein
MTIRKNMGTFDRVARLIVGLALLGAGRFGELGAGWDLALVAATAILLATAATGFCPGYLPFGISTRRAPRPAGAPFHRGAFRG